MVSKKDNEMEEKDLVGVCGLYCAACGLMPPDLIRQAIGEMEEMLASQQVDGADLKAKAKAMRAPSLCRRAGR